MFVLKQLTNPTLKRLYKFVLKRLIGRFLLTELNLDQLDVHLRTGKVELVDLHLDPMALNEFLVGLPFHVHHGYLGSVQVNLSYSNIMTESCVVAIDSVDIVLVPNSVFSGEPVARPQPSSHEEQVHYDGADESKEYVPKEEKRDEGDEGLDFVANWIEQISSKIKVSVSNINIHFADNPDATDTALTLSLQWAEYTDETPSDHQHFDSDSTQSNSQRRSFSNSIPGMEFGSSHKGIRFKGISACLKSHFGSRQQEAENFTLVANDPTRQCFIQLKLSQYNAAEVPQLDADVFVHSIRLQFEPRVFAVLGKLATAFADASTESPINPDASQMFHSVLLDKADNWLQEPGTDKSTESGGVVLSAADFRRIERMLWDYQKTRKELSLAASKYAGSILQAELGGSQSENFDGRGRFSSADSIHSEGLSDLDLEEDFFECETSLGQSMLGESKMGMSMYMSAAPEKKSNPSRRSIQTRVKIHLLECEVALIYADRPGKEDEESEPHTLRDDKDAERLVLQVKDLLGTWIVFSHQTTGTLTLGHLGITEFMYTKHSTTHKLIKVDVFKIVNSCGGRLLKKPLGSQVNIQIRMEYKGDETKLQKEADMLLDLHQLHVGVQCMPIHLEWDMSMLVRLKNFLDLLEEKDPEEEAESDGVSRTLEISTEYGIIALRFPLVPSDPVRYGPSSTRGLCEDKLTIELQNLLISSVDKSVEGELPWLAQYDISFTTGVVACVYPEAGNQRSKTFKRDEFLRITGDELALDGVGNSLRICLQQPTRKKVLLATQASPNHDNYVSTEDNSNYIHTADGGDDQFPKDYSAEWSIGARIEETTSAASQTVVICSIARAHFEIAKETFDRLLILVDALVSLDAEPFVDVFDPEDAASFLTFKLDAREGELLFHDAVPNDTSKKENRFSYKLAFERFSLFNVSQWLGRPMSRIHVSSQAMTLYEIKHIPGGEDVAFPVLYRTPWGVPKFEKGVLPLIFIMVEISDMIAAMQEVMLSINFSTLSLRYEVDSAWLFHLLDILLTEYPLPSVPCDRPDMTQEEFSAACLSIDQDSATSRSNSSMEERKVFTKLFVNCYDGIIDYKPLDLTSRAVIVLGLVQVSSNLVTNAQMQGYKFLFNDIEFFLTDKTDNYNEDNCGLCGATTTLAQAQLSTSESEFFGVSKSFSIQEHLEDRFFLHIGTLTTADIFLRSVVEAPDDERKQRASSASSADEFSLPDTSVELSLGLAKFYTCYDSCNTLFELINAWSESYLVVDEPADLGAYVGLDKVQGTEVKSRQASSHQNSNTASPLENKASGLSILHHENSEHHLKTTTTNPKTAPLSILSEIEENAFGVQQVNGGVQDNLGRVPSDTEARLRRTQLEKSSISFVRPGSHANAIENEANDDELTAGELRRKYSDRSIKSVNVQNLVIEDYYTMSQKGGDSQKKISEKQQASQSSASKTSPWFVSNTNNSLQAVDDDGATGSDSDQFARWLPERKVLDLDTTTAMSATMFEAIDSDEEEQQLPSPTHPTTAPNSVKDIASSGKEARGFVVDEKDAGILEEQELYSQSDIPKPGVVVEAEKSLNWWNSVADVNVELSQFDGKEGLNSSENEEEPMSMSLICSGEYEGTEVELDFKNDGKLELSRLLSESQEALSSSSSSPPTSPTGKGMSEDNLSHQMTTFSAQDNDKDPTGSSPLVSEALAEEYPLNTPTSNFSPSSFQQAGWYQDENSSTPNTAPKLRIYPHHVEIPASGSAAALSFGEKEKNFALRAVAGDDSTTSSSKPRTVTHVLLRDFSLQWRLFGGTDWVDGKARRKATADSIQARSSVNQTKTTKDSKTDKLLGALLDNYVPTSDKSVASSLFPSSSGSSAPEKQPKAAAFMNTYPKPVSRRKTEQMVELSLSRIQLRLDIFDENGKNDEHQPLASNLVVTIRDFEILDYISTSRIRKLLCYWKSDQNHPRVSNTSMAQVHLMAIRPGPKLCEEHRLRCRLLPLRINLDQDAIDFLRNFFTIESEQAKFTEPTDVNVSQAQPAAVCKSAPHTFNPSLSPLNNHHLKETDVNVGAWFFQSCDVRACKIKIDYRPQRVNYNALRNGDYFEVINLFVLEGMELMLRHVRLTGMDGWGAVGEAVLMSWVNDISRHQIHKCVASVSMPPMRSIANVGSGAADLILLPMEQYGRDRRLVRGIKRGAQSFLRTVTVETLNTASKVARGTQALLEHADDVVSTDVGRRRRRSAHKLQRNMRKGNSRAEYLVSQPSDAREGLSQAYSSISRELQTAAKTIIAVPMVEYKKTGPHGYVKSVIRAVPVAVLRPMIGATEAISRALIGVRNEVDPEMKEDMENMFKDSTMQ